MKRYLLSICLIALILSSYTFADDCPEGINLLPMYGRAKKCPGQIKADNAFLKLADSNYKDRKQAAKYFVNRAWGFYYQNKPDTAMMRFNQAWLLDSLNANVYWGFANLVGAQGKFKESLPLFNRAIQLDSSNAKLWESASNSYGNLYFKTRETTYLNAAIKYLKKAIALDPQVRTYISLTAAYANFTKKDSAIKYMHITDGLDKTAIDPKLRQHINKQL
jgi:tetratricopeptide (TPR) repeat protein